ncbi:sensor histidine kinase [Angelakisella massiliensis]|uniref:sensor histidine kinase n=1 Tax=Angelakisella massiliensis TaxID=1871018 RepID=UPI0008F8C0B5|nr:HAMP domain-containing sensor histidine kinase [Angelakisella massiliensis]
MIQKQLRRRIIQMNLLFLLPVLALCCALALSIIVTLMRQAQVRLLTSESYMSQVYLMDRLKYQGDSKIQREQLRSSAKILCGTLAEISSLRIQLYSAEGDLLADSNSIQQVDVTEDVHSAVEGVKAYQFFRGGPGKAYISFSSPVYTEDGETVGVIRYLTAQGDLTPLEQALPLLGILVLMMAGICYGCSSLLAGIVSQPVQGLVQAFEKVKEGKPAQLHLEVFRKEFAELEQAFSAMEQANRYNIQRLGEEKERQNLFFNSVTHQLKTPLTSIIGYSEIIQRMSQDEDVNMSACYIQQAGQHLLMAVENMINISRLQRTEYEFSPSWFSLERLCDECAQLLHPRLERSGIALHCRCSSLQVYYDREKIREVLLNLLDNCIVHSGCRCISITTATLPVRLMIEDDGDGVDETVIAHLFEPFSRSSSAPLGGSGLGLSICKEIMVAQGGDIGLESVSGGGTKVIIYFQRQDEPQNWYGGRARRGCSSDE